MRPRREPIYSQLRPVPTIVPPRHAVSSWAGAVGMEQALTTTEVITSRV